jgi:hypothetical protein
MKLQTIIPIILFLKIYSIPTSGISIDISKTPLNLQEDKISRHSKKNIYYYTIYKPNNITGTGNLLEDTAYRTICATLACSYGCCNGDINVMKCGTEADCDEYNSYKLIGKIIMIIILSLVGLFFILCLALKVCNRNKTTKENMLLAGLIVFIIAFIPFVSVYLIMSLISKCGKFKERNVSINK